MLEVGGFVGLADLGGLVYREVLSLSISTCSKT